MFPRIALLSTLVVCSAAAASDREQRTADRQPLPSREALGSDIFFADAFRDGLVGPRPQQLGQAKTPPTGRPFDQPENPARETARGLPWSRVVTAETLEDEVKALAIAVAQQVTTPSRFRSGGYQEVRRLFSELAVLFAMIGEFDGRIRWHKEAPTARDRFARAAANAKVSSLQAFQEAKQRKLDLEELVRGGTLSVSPATPRQADWSRVTDRGPLMQRFTIAHEGRIAKWTANGVDFQSHRRELQHESRLLKAFAVMLYREGMVDADDEDYVSYCRDLAAAADAISQAVRDDDAAAARQAASDMGKSCVQCHEDYRAS